MANAMLRVVVWCAFGSMYVCVFTWQSISVCVSGVTVTGDFGWLAGRPAVAVSRAALQ